MERKTIHMQNDISICDKCKKVAKPWETIDCWSIVDGENYCLECSKEYKVGWYENHENEKPKIKERVLVNGSFDVLHVAHLSLLKYARKFGDHLTVAINSDSSIKHNKGPNRPINNQNDRAGFLALLGFIDKVVIFNEFTAEEVLEREKPQIWVKGGTYNLDNIPIGEKMACLRNGIDIKFFDYMDGYSTTKIIEKTKAFQNSFTFN